MDAPAPQGFPRLDALITTAREGIWLMDADARTTFASERLAEMLGCTPSEMIGKPATEFFDDDRPEERLEALRRGQRRLSVCRFRRKDGSQLWALVSATPIRDERGNYHGALSMITDVTAQRNLEEEKSLILDSMSDQLAYLDSELRIRHVNRAAADSVPEEAIGRYCYELRRRRTSPCPDCPALKTFETREPAEAEKLDEHGRVWHLRTFPVFGRDGAVVGVAEFRRDVTETKRAAEALRERDKTIRAVLEASRNPVVVVRALRDEGGRIYDFEGILANPAAEALMGRCAGARLIAAHQAVETPDVVSLYTGVVESGEPLEIEVNFHKHGHARSFILSAVKLGDGAAVTFTEITGHKAIELEAARLGEQLRQTEIVKTATRLATGIAHDLSNLLQSIYASTSLAEALLPPSHPARENLRHTFTAARAATGLVRRLSTIRASAAFQPVPLHLNRLIEEYADVLACIVGERVALRLDLRAELDRVQGVASELEQVLLNLCLNARDAMPRGGKIIVSTGDVTQGPAKGGITGDPGRCCVRLSVSDTGTGMPREVLDRIFEPFFTTKAPEHGTGLGLPTARGIVERHAGTIEVESTEGEGTTVRILLPWWKA